MLLNPCLGEDISLSIFRYACPEEPKNSSSLREGPSRSCSKLYHHLLEEDQGCGKYSMSSAEQNNILSG